MKSKADNMRLACRRKFLRAFPSGFYDPKYISWERGYKWEAHLKWQEVLNKKNFEAMLKRKDYLEISRLAAGIESKTNLLFSFEKMAFRDATKDKDGAKMFAEGLYQYIYGQSRLEKRFDDFAGVLAGLPRKQTRVLTWPVQTVFGFIALPEEILFLKPMVTKRAAQAYGFPVEYSSRINWGSFNSFLELSEQISSDISDLKPRDLIDIQSFMWVLGSDEYEQFN